MPSQYAGEAIHEVIRLPGISTGLLDPSSPDTAAGVPAATLQHFVST